MIVAAAPTFGARRGVALPQAAVESVAVLLRGDSAKGGGHR